MSKKLLAITFSDLHLHNWKSHNDGMYRTGVGVSILIYLANKYPDIPKLFPGDLFHGEIGPKLLGYVEEKWPKNFRKSLYAISGNHDQEEKSYLDAETPSMVTYFSKKGRLINMDFQNDDLGDFNLHGIPYLTYNKGFMEAIQERVDNTPDNGKPNILMIHTDLYGATEIDGREVNTVENLPRDMGKAFEAFDLVLCGHIHKPQEIIPGHIIMVGAPNQQRRSDAQGTFGYWEIYQDLSYKFIALDTLPKFRFYDEGTEPENTTDYWIMLRKEADDVAEPSGIEFSNTVTHVKLAQSYLKATNENRLVYKRALINALREVEDDNI